MKKIKKMTRNNLDKTLIILDTNTVKEGKNNHINHAKFSSNSFIENIEDFLEKNKIKEKVFFGIPEVVLKEHLFHRKKDFEKDFNELKKKTEQFRKMNVLEEGKLDIEFRESFDYEDYLFNLVKNKDNLVLLEVPENMKKTIYERILKKSVNHEKPFDNDGDSNFKDALIWECISCKNFRDYACVLLITFNPKDFPKNNDFDEINEMARNTGKMIRIINKEEDLKQELTKIYRLVEKELENYLNGDYFRNRLKGELKERYGSPVELDTKYEITKLKEIDIKENNINKVDKDLYRWVNLNILIDEDPDNISLLFDIPNKSWKIEDEIGEEWES